jgi:hypothetical protein
MNFKLNDCNAYIEFECNQQQLGDKLKNVSFIKYVSNIFILRFLVSIASSSKREKCLVVRKENQRNHR